MKTIIKKNNDPKLSFALECTNSISWEIHLDLGKLVFSDNFESKYGICQADYNYNFKKFLDLHLNPHKEQILESIDKHLYGESDFAAIGEITLFNDKHNLHWLHARGKCIKYDQKVIYGVSVDITERKKIEERLAKIESANRLQMINEIKQNELMQLLSKFSRREQEVIKALLAGHLSYKELSGALNISVNTVKTHLKHIYQITGVSNIAALLSLFQRLR